MFLLKQAACCRGDWRIVASHVGVELPACCFVMCNKSKFVLQFTKGWFDGYGAEAPGVPCPRFLSFFLCQVRWLHLCNHEFVSTPHTVPLAVAQGPQRQLSLHQSPHGHGRHLPDAQEGQGSLHSMLYRSGGERRVLCVLSSVAFTEHRQRIKCEVPFFTPSLCCRPLLHAFFFVRLQYR